jgi:hypothetical protein
MTVTTSTTASNVLVFEFAGTVASGTRGQNVDVLWRGCGVRGFGLVAVTRTRAGGRWRVEHPDRRRPFAYPRIYSGTTFRARSKGQLSAPYVYRAEAPIKVTRVTGRLARRVHVAPPPPGTISLKGKIVELQRLRGRRWVTIDRKPLALDPSYEHGALNHEAVFPVQYGWMLRIALPAKSAAPCYKATFTEPFRIWS